MWNGLTGLGPKMDMGDISNAVEAGENFCNSTSGLQLKEYITKPYQVLSKSLWSFLNVVLQELNLSINYHAL